MDGTIEFTEFNSQMSKVHVDDLKRIKKQFDRVWGFNCSGGMDNISSYNRELGRLEGMLDTFFRAHLPEEYEDGDDQ